MQKILTKTIQTQCHFTKNNVLRSWIVVKKSGDIDSFNELHTGQPQAIITIEKN